MTGRAALATPPHSFRRDYLFIDVQHGMCNRLRAMASADVIARATGRRLVVVWRPDHHCEARLRDLIDYGGVVVEDESADALRREHDIVFNYMEIEPGSRFQAPIFGTDERFDGRNVFIRSAYLLNSPLTTREQEHQVLRELRPVETVQALVARVRHPNDVAAHIRMAMGEGFDHLSYEAPGNWPAHRHRELTEWREKSDVGRFMLRLDRLVAAGEADSVFVAADLPETYATLQERYGARIAHLPRRAFDRSAEQVQYALADLLLLTSARRLLASGYSSFSHVADILSGPGIPCERSGYDF